MAVAAACLGNLASIICTSKVRRYDGMATRRIWSPKSLHLNLRLLLHCPVIITPMAGGLAAPEAGCLYHQHLQVVRDGERGSAQWG